MQALILAGGKGTRLRPLTMHTPKPIVPIANRPFLLYQLELIKGADVRDVILSLSNAGTDTSGRKRNQTAPAYHAHAEADSPDRQPPVPSLSTRTDQGRRREGRYIVALECRH